jgi:hypothetical protein
LLGALFELGLAHTLSGHSAIKAAALVGGVIALAIVFTYPIAGAVGLLVMTASIFYAAYFSWSVGPIRIHLEELIFASLALAAIVVPRRRTWGGATGTALAAFLGLVVVCAVVGVADGRVSISDAFDWARPLAFYGSFWVVLRLFPDPSDLRRLLFAALACGALTGLVAVILQLAPSLVSHFQGPGGQQIYTQAAQAGLGNLKRIRLPGLACSYVLFWWSLLAAMSAPRGRRTLLWVLVGASATNLALSFNRNMWLGLLFGLALILVLVGPRVRHRLVIGTALGATAILLTFTVVGAGSSAQAVDPILARARQRGELAARPRGRDRPGVARHQGAPAARRRGGGRLRRALPARGHHHRRVDREGAAVPPRPMAVADAHRRRAHAVGVPDVRGARALEGMEQARADALAGRARGGHRDGDAERVRDAVPRRRRVRPDARGRRGGGLAQPRVAGARAALDDDPLR